MERKHAIIGSEKLNIEDDDQEIIIKNSKNEPTSCNRVEVNTNKYGISPQFSPPKILSNDDYINVEEVEFTISPNHNINLQIPRILRCLKCECLPKGSLFMDHLKKEVSNLGNNYKKLCSCLNPYTIILSILNMNGDFIHLLNNILINYEDYDFLTEIQKFKHFILALMATIKNQGSQLPPNMKNDSSHFTVWAAGLTNNNNNIELFKQNNSFMILNGFRFVHRDMNKALKNLQQRDYSCIYELIINKEDSPNVLTSEIKFKGIDDSDLYVLNPSLIFSFKDYSSNSKNNLIIRAEIMSNSYYQILQRRINNQKRNQVPIIEEEKKTYININEFDGELSIKKDNHTPNYSDNEIFPNSLEEEKVEKKKKDNNINNINEFSHDQINRLIQNSEMDNELDKTGPSSFDDHNTNIHFPPADSQIEGNIPKNGFEKPSYTFH
jgi:hypothetical protein